MALQKISMCLIFSVLGLCIDSGARVSANVISNWPRDTSVSCVGEGCGPAYAAELFQALPGFLETATIGFAANIGNENKFRVLLTSTTPLNSPIVEGGGYVLNRRPDKLVFASPMMSVPADSTNQVFQIDFGGIDLVDGNYYALIIDAFQYFDGQPSQGEPYWTDQNSGFKPQPNDIAFFFGFGLNENSPTNISDHFMLNNEPVSIGGDLAFIMNFDTTIPDQSNPTLSFLPLPSPTITPPLSPVPEPPALSLLMFGVVAAWFTRRRITGYRSRRRAS